MEIYTLRMGRERAWDTGECDKGVLRGVAPVVPEISLIGYHMYHVI